MTLYDDLNHYEVGDLVRVTGVFTDQATGAPIDPAALTFRYKTPAGVTTSLTYAVDAAVVRDGTGSYRVDISASATGIWSWRWASTGSGQAADEGRFYIKPSLL